MHTDILCIPVFMDNVIISMTSDVMIRAGPLHATGAALHLALALSGALPVGGGSSRQIADAQQPRTSGHERDKALRCREGMARVLCMRPPVRLSTVDFCGGGMFICSKQ